MSKRKVGKLYRKRIVEGNINEVNLDSEVHIDSLKGGSTDGGVNSWKYFDFTGYSAEPIEFAESIPALFHLVRWIRKGQDEVLPLAVVLLYSPSDEMLKAIKAVGVDMSAKVRNNPFLPTATTMAELFTTDVGGITLEQAIKDMWGLVEITEEEFLNKTFE